MTCEIHHFPSPALITADRDGQLTAALAISNHVFSGEWASLPAMICAREVIDSRTHAKATVELLTVHIDARRDEIRRQARRGMIRGELVGLGGLAVVVAVSAAMLKLGGAL